MFRGVLFFIKLTWKYSKSALIYLIFKQLFAIIIPISVIVLPKYIIDELTGKRSIERIIFF